jgi:NADPH:quinone reductase
MRALVVEGNGAIALGEVDDPVAGPSEAIVEVAATSINRVDVRALHDPSRRSAGPAGGLDLAGRVVRAAVDGTGPPVGARVMGYSAGGAWAEYATVPTATLAALPDDVAFVEAATVPTAGLTALRALALGGPLLGARVLVTGASGGVGMFAVQLAKLAGAQVTAAVRTVERAHALEKVVDGLDVRVGAALDGRFDVILDGVGSTLLTASLRAVAPRGTVVQFGRSAGDGQDAPPAQIDESWFGRSMGAKLVAMVLTDELVRHQSGARDLALLATLVSTKQVTVPLQRRVPWADASQAIADATRHGLVGKVALVVRDEPV